MGSKIRERIELLREKMKEKEISAWYISGTDPHQSEDLPLHWQSREFITGFTGSMGMVVITLQDAALWTDSRYFLQAGKELEKSGVRLMKLRTEGFPTPAEWLKTILPAGSMVGTDGECISAGEFRSLKNLLAAGAIGLTDTGDLLDGIWKDRDPIPATPVFEHELRFAGSSRTEKTGRIRELLKAAGAQSTIISSLDDLAWLFNLRGRDVISNPVFIGYGMLTTDFACIYVNPEKMPPEISEKLMKDEVSVRPYRTIFDDLRHLKGKVLIDPARTNQALYETLPETAEIVEQLSLPARAKAVKSSAELKQIRQSMIKDGVAMVQLLHWIDQTVGVQEITDYDIAVKTEYFRSLQEGFTEASFPPIVGYKETGALVHRRVSRENAVPVLREGVLLIDSGGQYLSGTTDITRTVSLGQPSAQEKQDFTLALKGMISLSTARFPAGLRGVNLDILARKAMWDQGINYGHGTSHGVGFFLNVHEGPMSIRMEYNENPIVPGMVLSNEPGIYREGLYGVRTENMMVCVEKETSQFGQFYGFDTLTLCPIDLCLIEKSLLTEAEKDWINRYHQQCRQILAPFLSREETDFLRSITQILE